VQRLIAGPQGVRFENFPVYRYNGEDYTLMRNEWFAQQIERFVPKGIRHVARFNCRLIPEFHEELPCAAPTAPEIKIIKWLQKVGHRDSFM